MRKICCVVLFLWLIVGCTSTKDQYSNFPEQVKGRPVVFVVIDAIALSDIAGKDVGFNVEKNEVVLNEISNTVTLNLVERGYDPTIVVALNGLFYNLDEEKKYFFSEDWNSTSEPYISGINANPESKEWYTEEIKGFFANIIENLTSKDIEEQRKHRITDPIPEVMKGYTDELVLYVQVQAELQSVSKQWGVGLLGAGVSLALSAALPVTILGIPTPEPTRVKAVVLDLQSEDVLWFNNVSLGDFKTIKSVVNSTLFNYPKVDGSYVKKETRIRKN